MAMRRRDFVVALFSGPALTWSLPGHAQQEPLPTIGFLRNTSAKSSQQLISAFHKGLAEGGLIENRNVRIEYRWANDQENELPRLASDLVAHKAAVIVAGGGSVVALAAKQAGGSIPIVFELGGDPVKLGLVASLNRPGANLTGVALFSNTIGPKRIEFLHQIAKAKSIGLLVDPSNPNAKAEVQLAQDAAKSLSIRALTLEATAESEIEQAFAKSHQVGLGGLVVMATPLFVGRRDLLVALAARNSIPAIYPFPSFAEAGGLMSYGDDLADAFRQVGVYTARIINGERPADLPVVQPTKFEFVINLRTAKSQGLDVPATLLATADKVIE